MRKKSIFFIILALSISLSVSAQESKTRHELAGNKFGPVIETGKAETSSVEEIKMPVIEIKGDWIYIDGERFFIKGICYGGWRPNQIPGEKRYDLHLVDNDFRLIREAGFNAIRVWSALDSQELALARKHGLMVLQDIFVDPAKDFVSVKYQDYVLNTISKQVQHCMEEPNILMFLVANKQPITRVLRPMVVNTEKILSLLVDVVQKIDPNRLVTFSNWVELAFINNSMLPIIAFNVYMSEPHIVSHALSYKVYIEWLKRKHAKNKPLIITELGLSVSAYGPGKFGRGGNTEEEQRDGTIMMFEDIINAGAVGGCIFEWADEWWKNNDYSGDQHKHESTDPEEWFGVTEIKDETSDLRGRPRLVYQALKEYNQAIIINPKNIEFYSGKIPIEIYTTDNAAKLLYRINSGTWNSLSKVSPHWWQAAWDSAEFTNGKQVIEIQAQDEKGTIVCSKSRIFWTNNQPGFIPPIYKITLATDKEKYIEGDNLVLTVTVKNSNDEPVKNIPVDYAFYESKSCENAYGTKNTDEKGRIHVKYYINGIGFISIGAGVVLHYGEYTRKFGDVIAVEAEKKEKPVILAKELEVEKTSEPSITQVSAEKVTLPEPGAKTQQELIGNQFGPVIETGKTETQIVEELRMPVIEIKGDWIYVDSERFFIRGMGYSGWRPHQLPWAERPDPILMDNDFRLISEAGFNTIRTWTALNVQELALARKYGLMVIQGIFVDPTRDFGSPVYQNYVVTTVKNQVRYYIKEPNILVFLIANEPPVERVRTSGVENTEKVLGLMVDSVRQLDPNRLVTFSNWVQLAFISHAMLPVIAFNVYMYEPHIVTHALTYKGYVEWLKKKIAQDKPLIITELGLSVSSYGPGKFGRGGNTEEEQRDGTIIMYEDIINAGAVGGCIFEWNDEWWKNYDYSGDQHKHETTDPEEWFGVAEIKDDTSDLRGRTRLVYQALKEYNQALIINPKNIEFYSGKIQIEVYTMDSVKKLSYRLNNGLWNSLEKVSPHWWQATWDSATSNDGKQILEIQAQDEREIIICNKNRIFWTNNQPGFVPPIYKVSLVTDKQKYIIEEKMEKLLLTVTVKDNNDKPVRDIPVDYAFYESRFWQSVFGTKNTDENGQIQVEYYINESGFINIGAGATLHYGEYTRKFGDVIAVEVEKIEKLVILPAEAQTAETTAKEITTAKTADIKTKKFLLFDPGTEKIPDYGKYGRFNNIGTRKYFYEMKDEEGLAKAVGEGVFPNGISIYKDPEYQRYKKEGLLDGNHWDFVNIDDNQASFYKWALAEEDPGVAQYYTAMALEKAGLLEQAIKAYYACIIHFPNSMGWTYFHTPWYIGRSAVDKIMYITRNHPELRTKLISANVFVEGGFDNNPYNDVVIVNPGKLISCKPEEVPPAKIPVEGLEIVERRGKPPTELVKYKNGHWQFLVNGKPFISKAISYFPVTVGQSPDEGNLADWMNQDTNGNGKPDAPYDAWVDKNFNNIQDQDEQAVGDFGLFKEIGANTLRLYHHASNKELLRDLYKTYGIRVMMGDFLGMYCTGSGAKWEEGTDYTNEEQRKNMLESVKQMVMEYKDEPYILMWVLGNENNYGGTFGHVGGAGNAGQYPDVYYTFVNEAAKWIHSVDPTHPVAICNGDTLFLDILTKYAPEIDIFGANSYRGANSFEHSIWNDIKNVYDRPAIIMEYGCPLYIEDKPEEYQEEKQAEYYRGNWEGIYYNSCGYGVGNSIGGVVFEWVDGWWKSGQPPRFSSWMHEVKGNWIGPFPGNWSYEEWFGLTGQGDGTKSPFMRQLRKVFYEYKEMWTTTE